MRVQQKRFQQSKFNSIDQYDFKNNNDQSNFQRRFFFNNQYRFNVYINNQYQNHNSLQTRYFINYQNNYQNNNYEYQNQNQNRFSNVDVQSLSFIQRLQIINELTQSTNVLTNALNLFVNQRQLFQFK